MRFLRDCDRCLVVYRKLRRQRRIPSHSLREIPSLHSGHLDGVLQLHFGDRSHSGLHLWIPQEKIKLFVQFLYRVVYGRLYSEES